MKKILRHAFFVYFIFISTANATEPAPDDISCKRIVQPDNQTIRSEKFIERLQNNFDPLIESYFRFKFDPLLRDNFLLYKDKIHKILSDIFAKQPDFLGSLPLHMDTKFIDKEVVEQFFDIEGFEQIIPVFRDPFLEFTKLLNESNKSMNRKLVKLSYVRIAYSDGTMPQVSRRWHKDNGINFTLSILLEGKLKNSGTELKVDGKSIYVEEGEGVFYSTDVLHRASPGEAPRFTLLVGWDYL